MELNTSTVTLTSAKQLNQSQVKISMGTLIRGDEWKDTNTRNEQNKAVVTSLRSLAKHFGAQNLTVMVDNTLSCEALPAFLSGTQCLGVEHCRDETFHSPTMGCVFSSFLSAREHARNDIIGFINGDILIFESFVNAIQICNQMFQRFLLVGRRHLSAVAVSYPESLSQWSEIEQQTEDAILDGPFAVDYFVTRFSESQNMQEIPNFIVGTQRWDNFLLMKYLNASKDLLVVDATFVAPVLHQVMNKVETHEDRPAAEFNDNLAFESSGFAWRCGSIDNSHLVLINTSDGKLVAENVTTRHANCIEATTSRRA